MTDDAMDQAVDSAAGDAAPLGFPDWSAAAGRSTWRRRALGAGGVAVAFALVAGIGVARASGTGNGGYRTAAVGVHDVESVLTGVGSVEPASQATAAFPVAGTVASVDVSVGQQVGTGQQLATLDTTQLTATLNQRQATLAQAPVSYTHLTLPTKRIV